jgi:hypothetical protein
MANKWMASGVNDGGGGMNQIVSSSTSAGANVTIRYFCFRDLWINNWGINKGLHCPSDQPPIPVAFLFFISELIDFRQ